MLKKILSFCLIGIMMFGLVACGEKEPDVFSAMTMVQKRSFVTKYMSETYNMDVGVTSDVMRIKDTEYSYAIARTPEGKQVHCWIKEDKTVVDDKFILDKEQDFVDLFSEQLTKHIADYKISCVIELGTVPTEEIKKMDAKDIMSLEGTKTTVSVLITRESRSKINSLVAKQFNGDLDFANGNVYVYVVDDLKSASFSGLNTTSCESSCKISVPTKEVTTEEKSEN